MLSEMMERPQRRPQGRRRADGAAAAVMAMRIVPLTETIRYFVGLRSRAIRCASAICAGVYWCPVRCLNLYVWLTAPLQHAQIHNAR
jgi:hypothetical protein